jgi:hypothetical protein
LIFAFFLSIRRDMIRLEFDAEGRVSGMPIELPPQTSVVFELVSPEIDIVDTDTMSLRLALEKPEPIKNGTWTITFGANSFSINAADVSAYSIGHAFNRLASVVSAGGLTVTGERGIFTLSFLAVGSRSAPTVSHSALGSETGRCATITAGSDSAKAVFELDLSAQILAAQTTSDDITSATVTVANIATGTTSVAQRDQITISRQPYRGKWQVWISAGTATEWLQPDASTYKVQTALDSVAPDTFLVSSENRGVSTIFDVRRKAVGVNAALTVADTFIGPVGVSLTLDASKVGQLLRIAGSTTNAALLIFQLSNEVRFSQPVRLSPALMGHGQPI